MVKRLLAITAILFMAAACASCTAKTSDALTTAAASGTSVADTGKTTENWSEGVYLGDAVPDEETAQKLADILFSRIIKKSRDEYTYTSVDFDEENNSWIVIYCLNENTLGGYDIIIAKKTGEVLRVELGE